MTSSDPRSSPELLSAPIGRIIAEFGDSAPPSSAVEYLVRRLLRLILSLLEQFAADRLPALAAAEPHDDAASDERPTARQPATSPAGPLRPSRRPQDGARRSAPAAAYDATRPAASRGVRPPLGRPDSIAGATTCIRPTDMCASSFGRVLPFAPPQLE